jgi:hypothetical protein
VESAIGAIRMLIQLGRHLDTQTWLVALFAPEIRCIERWLRQRVWQRRPCDCKRVDDEVGLPCGTDILAYLPFDPNREAWWERLVKARDFDGRFDVAAVRLDDSDPIAPDDFLLVGSPWLRFVVREQPPSPGGATVHKPGERGEALPQASHHQGEADKHFKGERVPRRQGSLPKDWDAQQPWLWCATLAGWVRDGVTWRESSLASSGGKKNGKGALYLPTSDPRYRRPLFDVLCNYLRDYWMALAWLKTPQSEARGVYGTYPFVGDTDDTPGWRHTEVGWPARNGGPAALTLPLPGGDLTQPARTGTWYRINRNIFVLLESDSTGFHSSRIQADAAGLAIRLLEASMPLWKDVWEDGFYSGGGFELDIKGSHATHNSLLARWRYWFTNVVDSPLMVFLRDYVQDNDAQGRAHPANYGITLATDKQDWIFQDIVDDLESLRARAAAHFYSGGTSVEGLSPLNIVDKLWAVGDPLIREAELAMHESGHTISWVDIGSETGIDGDHNEGSSHRNAATDIKSYRFPEDESPILSKHYGVTLAAVWWESIMRQNTRPRDRLVKVACKCSGGAGQGPFRDAPHYGGWGRDDDTCFEGGRAGWDFDNETCGGDEWP